jgi:hypothetical protein
MSKKQSAANEPLTTEEQMAFATMASLADIDLRKLCIKVAIGYAFFVIGYIAAEHAAVTLALLVSPVWLQLVICFFVLAAGLVGLVIVTPAVTNSIYDGAAWAITKTKSFVSGFKMPSIKMPFAKNEATVH